MEINEKNIKLWSALGSRAVFGLAMFEEAKKRNDLMMLTCDVSTSAGLDRYRKKYPEKYIDLGISEQNLIGVASGLSHEGYEVFTTTFSPFQTLRCCEQIKVNMGYMKNKIVMVGLASGLCLGTLGFTHCSIEDIGSIRSIPNIDIISPADCLETIKAVEASFAHNNSLYIRLTGSSNNGIVNNEDYDYKIGKSIEIENFGKDFVIISCGSILKNCLDVVRNLNKKNINGSLINMHTIKPIDKNKIVELSKQYKNIFTFEEHNIYGGLGSAVAEVLSNISTDCILHINGVRDEYIKGGSYKYLLEKYNLSVEKIEKKIKNQLNI